MGFAGRPHYRDPARVSEVADARTCPPRSIYLKGTVMDIKQKIEKANQETANRMMAGSPVLVDIAPARDVIPGLKGKMIIHSGPPIEWRHMCGAQQGAIIGQILYEKWANNTEEASAFVE